MLEANLENRKDVMRILRAAEREMTRDGGKAVQAGLLAATDGIVEQVRTRVPKGRTGRLRKSVGRRLFVDHAGNVTATVGYITAKPRSKARKGRRPRFMQAVASEYGWKGNKSFTRQALRSIATTVVFPQAVGKYAKGFENSYNQFMRTTPKGKVKIFFNDAKGG